MRVLCLRLKIKKSMTHTYQIAGMTCANCEAKVKSALFTLPDVTSAEVSKDAGTATITMSTHIPLAELQKAIDSVENGKYKISTIHHNETVEQAKSWFETYKPILLIFGYITAITLLVQYANSHFIFMQWMQHFM